jgi:mRNA (guanine-N7-)-methyltransferase
MAEEFHLFPIYKEEFHHVFDQNRQHPEFGPLMVHMKVVDASGESSMDEEQWEAASMFSACCQWFSADLLR